MPTVKVDQASTKAVLRWLLAAREPKARQDSLGRSALGYSWTYRWLIIGAVCISSSLLILGSVATWDDSKALLLVASILGCMWLGSLYLARDAFVVKLRVEEHGISRRGLLGQTAFLPWSEITDIKHSFHWFSFRARGCPTIRVSIYRNGLETLSEHAHVQLDSAVVDKAAVPLREKALNPNRPAPTGSGTRRKRVGT